MKVVSKVMAGALLALVLTACTTGFSIDTPEGFAPVQKSFSLTSSVLYKAVSPEGMLFKIRREDNYPKQDLEFWSKALKFDLEKRGYTLSRDADQINTESLMINAFEWSLPYQNDYYLYLTALLVAGDSIYIAEAGAKIDIYNQYRKSLFDSLKSIKIQM